MRKPILLSALVAVAAGLFGHGATAGPAPGIKPFSLGIFDGTIAERQALKTTWMRVGAHWQTVQPNEADPYDWTSTDAQIVPASQSGIQMMFGIRAISSWGANCGSSTLSGPRADKIAAFKDWVQAAAERYDGDGVDDAPGLGDTPIRVWQVENQWVTAVFFRGSDNCPAPAPANAESILGLPTAGNPPEATGDPVLAAKEYLREFKAVAEAVHAADPGALVGPGNIPTQTADAALFCEGKLGSRFVQNVLRADGSVAKTLKWTKAQVCQKDGANPRNIKTWVRYWNVVLNYVMPRIKTVTNYVDVAHYGRYQDVELRNKWLLSKLTKWGLPQGTQIVSWEAGGPDRRVTLPGTDPLRDTANDVPKRLALNFATGSASIAWFHNHFSSFAAVGVRNTSLLSEGGAKTPAYWNYRLFAERTLGASSATLRRIGSNKPGEGAYVVTFTLANGKHAIVAWADKGMSVTIDTHHPSVKVITFAGKKFPPAKNKATPTRKLVLGLGNTPLLVLD